MNVIDSSRRTIPLKMWKGASVNQVFGNGSCLTESLCYALYLPYHTHLIGGNVVKQNRVIREFKKWLANTLVEIDKSTGMIYYYSLYKIREMGYELDEIRNLLSTDAQLDIIMMFLVEVLYNVSIYVIDADSDEVRIVTRDIIGRDCIVLHDALGHFNPISVHNSQFGIEEVRILYDHPFVVHLRSKLP